MRDDAAWRWKMRIVVVAWLLLWATEVDAKHLCVNASTGSDATSYASNDGSAQNGSGTCWQTLGRAVWGSTTRSSPNTGEAAAAGDTVWIAAGTYGEGTATGSSGTVPLYNPANEGSSGSVVAFRCATSRGCVLTSSNYEGPVIGANSKDYITWDGFQIDESNTNQIADSGVAIIRDSNHITLNNIRIIGGVGNWGGTNHDGIRVEFSTFFTVSESEISGISGDNGTNDMGMVVYVSNNGLIEHNWFHDNEGAQLAEKTCQNGGTNWCFNNVYRYNRISGTSRAGAGFFVSAGGDPAGTGGVGLRFYGNLLEDLEQAITLSPLVSTTGTLKDYTLANNVIYDCHYAVYSGGTNRDGTAKLYNNIFSVVDYVYVDEGASDAFGSGGYTLEHNVYHSIATSFAQISFGNQSFATFKTNYGTDAASPASVTTNPNFVSAGTDFHLDAGSSADDLGRVVDSIGGSDGATIDAGLYITGSEIIGNGVAASSATRVRLRLRGP